MSIAVEEFEVVVVGAGPGGLASAVTLASHGIETLVVERRAAPSTQPRANTTSTATMELLRRWGLEEEARERAIDVVWQAWSCPTLAAGEGEAIDVGLPTPEQAPLVSPSAPASLAQDELEPLLEGHLASFPTARVERRVELLALEREGDAGYRLSLCGPEGARQVRARYVVGADGMRSLVRQELGIATDDTGVLEERFGVHLRAPLWELLGPRRYGIYFITGEPEGRFFVPAGKPDRWVFALPWDSEVDDASTLTEGDLTAMIRDAAGDPELPVEIERSMVVPYGTALAERFRDGNAFLIGDAAHRVTPRGGTGLNTAIHDGFDIGWKLAWVLRGWAGEDLLDSYERERRPVAEFNAGRSTMPAGSILGTALALPADIGGRIPHVWVERDGEFVSTLDLLAEGLTLFVGPDWDGALPDAAAGPAPLAVERVDAIAARGLGLAPGGSLLARPDGQPLALTSNLRARQAV